MPTCRFAVLDKCRGCPPLERALPVANFTETSSDSFPITTDNYATPNKQIDSNLQSLDESQIENNYFNTDDSSVSAEEIICARIHKKVDEILNLMVNYEVDPAIVFQRVTEQISDFSISMKQERFQMPQFPRKNINSEAEPSLDQRIEEFVSERSIRENLLTKHESNIINEATMKPINNELSDLDESEDDSSCDSNALLENNVSSSSRKSSLPDDSESTSGSFAQDSSSTFKTIETQSGGKLSNNVTSEHIDIGCSDNITCTSDVDSTVIAVYNSSKAAGATVLELNRSKPVKDIAPSDSAHSLLTPSTSKGAIPKTALNLSHAANEMIPGDAASHIEFKIAAEVASSLDKQWYGSLGNLQKLENMVHNQFKQLPELHLLMCSNNYEEFQPQHPNAEVSRVLEISGFSPLTTTDDLNNIFGQFVKYRGATIRWVDDTHALLILATVRDAHDALVIPWRKVQVKPIGQASKQSLDKYWIYDLCSGKRK